MHEYLIFVLEVSAVTIKRSLFAFAAAIMILVGNQAVLPQTIALDPNVGGIPGPFRTATFCRTSTHLWAVGGEGDIVRLTEGKPILRTQLVGRNQSADDLNGVFADESGNVFVVGNNGIIFHSRDDGKSWIQQSSESDLALNAITCSTQKECWAVGDQGLVLFTSNLGKSWQRRYTGTDDDLSDVEFVSERIGWIVGRDGLVMKTTDTGTNWLEKRVQLRQLGSPTDRDYSDVRAVRFIGSQNGWIVGSSGIARTTDGGNTWETTVLWDGAFVGLISQNGIKIWAINRGDNYCSDDAGKSWHVCNPSPTASGSLLNEFHLTSQVPGES